jgi:YVTN family beta-propeller protein
MGTIAASPDGSRIYVANYGNWWSWTNSISVINASSGEIMADLPAGEGPMDVKIMQAENARSGGL